jgi:hypothetical protein
MIVIQSPQNYIISSNQKKYLLLHTTNYKPENQIKTKKT